MALKKKKDNLNGTFSNYHRISSINIVPHYTEYIDYEEEVRYDGLVRPKPNSGTKKSKEEYEIVITVASFTNETVRRNNERLFLDEVKIERRVLKNSMNFNNLFSWAYNVIKEEEAFSGAEDC